MVSIIDPVRSLSPYSKKHNTEAGGECAFFYFKQEKTTVGLLTGLTQPQKKWYLTFNYTRSLQLNNGGFSNESLFCSRIFLRTI